MPLEPNMFFTASLTVTENQTAAAFGSGGLPVFATPALIAFAEKTCFYGTAPHLAEGDTTVGTLVNIVHSAASAVGAVVTCRARLDAIDRRRLVFSVELYEGEKKVASGTHERFIVNTAKFMSKLEGSA